MAVAAPTPYPDGQLPIHHHVPAIVCAPATVCPTSTVSGTAGSSACSRSRAGWAAHLSRRRRCHGRRLRVSSRVVSSDPLHPRCSGSSDSWHGGCTSGLSLCSLALAAQLSRCRPGAGRVSAPSFAIGLRFHFWTGLHSLAPSLSDLSSRVPPAPTQTRRHLDACRVRLWSGGSSMAAPALTLSLPVQFSAVKTRKAHSLLERAVPWFKPNAVQCRKTTSVKPYSLAEPSERLQLFAAEAQPAFWHHTLHTWPPLNLSMAAAPQSEDP